MKFTAEEKLKAVKRELDYRKFVFPKRVADGHMTQHQADERADCYETSDLSGSCC